MTRRIIAGAFAMSLVCVALAPVPASAQRRERRLEVSGGGLFAGGHDLVDTDADIVPNQTGGGTYRLFATDTRLDSAPGLEARLGWRVTPRFTVDGGVFMTRPRLVTRLSEDVENAPDLTASEDLSLYIIDAGLNVALGSASARVVPFVRLGAGYVRQLHEDNVLVETGQAYHAGGGMTAWFGPGLRRTGVRLDARVYVLQGGVDLGTSSRTMATGGAAFVFAF